MKSYEIQRRERGTWIHDSYYDDERTALDQARELVKRKLFDGVRVVEDVFIEGSRKSDARYLFSHVSERAASEAKKAPVRNDSAKPSEDVSRRTVSRARPEPESKPGGMKLWLILVVLAVLVVGGLVSLAGIEAFFNQ